MRSQAILLLGVISWHNGRCGERLTCFPGYLPHELGSGPNLLNLAPKVLGSSALSGLMLLAGTISASERAGAFWWRTAMTVAPALAVQFVAAPLFDRLLLPGGPIPTDGHVWFLYSVAIARVLDHLTALSCCALLQSREHTGRMVGHTALRLAPTLALHLLAAPVWHRLLPHVAKRLPALDGARYDGYTVSSGEWFVPFGVRCLTYPLFWTIGRVCLPPHTLSVLHARLHASRGRACAALWLLNASCWAYSLLRLETGGTNLFTSATPNVWASRLPRSLEMVLVSLVSPVALLMLLPNRPLLLVKWTCAATLGPYLLHPFVIKLVRPPVWGLIGMAARSAPLAALCLLIALELTLVPLALLAGLGCLSSHLSASLLSPTSRLKTWQVALPMIAFGVVLAALSPPPPPSRGRPAATAAAPPSTAAAVRYGKTASGTRISIDLVTDTRHLQHLPARAPDIYTCQGFDLSAMLPAAKPAGWAVASVSVPAESMSPASRNGSRIHHIIPYFCDVDATPADARVAASLASGAPFRCEATPFVRGCEKMLVAFALGDAKLSMPPGVALRLSSRLVLVQVHYVLLDGPSQLKATTPPSKHHHLRALSKAVDSWHVDLPPAPVTLELVRASAPPSAARERRGVKGPPRRSRSSSTGSKWAPATLRCCSSLRTSHATPLHRCARRPASRRHGATRGAGCASTPSATTCTALARP